MFFKNRNEAARELLERLEKYRNTNSVVLAVPRGGVPIGYEIASELGLPLDIILSKKIGHPSNPEYAIGSVTLDEVSVDDHSDVPREYIDREIKKIRSILNERNKRFMGNHISIPLQGKNIILVDDGVATGNTLSASINVLKKARPKKIILAIPVAPLHTADLLRAKVDEFICLNEASDFSGVGQFYLDFKQVTDEEVVWLLNKARNKSE